MEGFGTMIITLKDIAIRLMTAGVNGDFAKAMWEQWEYRNGKTKEDFEHARRKASKYGRGKLEFEIRMAEVYVGDVLKKRRKPLA
jgi:hypothetical protein